MAAFIAKQDFFGLADGTTLVCVSSDDGKSAEVAEAVGQDGSIVENNVYGEKISPSNDYLQKTDWEIGAGDLNLGDINALDSTTSVCLNNISIGTSAGSAPTISVSGE